jgi:integrase
MTTKTKRKYVMRTPDPERPGKSWVYFRVRGRPLVRLPDDESSSEFDRQYKLQFAALKGESLRKPNTRTPRKFSNERVAFLPGSLGWFIERYLASSKFDPANKKCFAKGTRYNYRKALDLMKARIGAGLLADLDSEALDVYSAGIEREHGASVADQQINLISNLWEFAKGFKEFKRKGRMNPTLDAKRHYRAGEGHQPWPDEVIERFEETAKPPLLLAVTVLRYSAQRGGDCIAMKRTDFNGERIRVVQEKTGSHLWLKCPKPLRKALETAPFISEYILNSIWKRPYANSTTLGHAIERHLKKIGIKGYTMHGLRKNAAVELAEAGATVEELMAVLGHKTPKMALHYCKLASQRRINDNATVKWDAEIERKAKAKVGRRRSQIKAVA